jgi:RecB family exonuclease
MLKLQSLCPFRAGAEQRLGARPLESPPVGIDPRQRGTLAHKALAHLWRDLKTSDVLPTLEAAALSARVEAAVKAAFADRRSRTTLDRLEQQWLRDALLRLLDVERLREAFRVDEPELEQTITLEGRQLKVRLDRLDRLYGGDTVLIDYKTGQAKISDWLGERPQDPQLPTYAAHLPRAPVAVAVARLAGNNTGFVGLSKRSGLLPGSGMRDVRGVPALAGQSWEQMLERWRALSVELAAQFAAGIARVDPLRGACRRCGLQGLCRVERLRAEPGDDDED